MRIGTGIAVYFVIWWTVLFVVLPMRLRTQGESGRVVPGTSESAPERPDLLRKVILTSILSAIVFLALLGLIHSGIGLDDIPFLPTFSDR